MKSISFQIHYQTKWGEQLAVLGAIPELGANEVSQAFLLIYVDKGWWRAKLELEKLPPELSYQYLVLDDQGGVLSRESGTDRQIQLEGESESIFLQDTWRAGQHPDNSLFTSAFTSAVFQPDPIKTKSLKSIAGSNVLRFNMRAPRVSPGYQLAICGNIPELGAWDLDKALLLGNEQYPQWTGAVRLQSQIRIEYKYVWRSKEGAPPIWEEGKNRLLEGVKAEETIILSDEYFHHPQGNWKGAGLALPVFSIRTRQSFGVGEFADVRLLVDWAKATGLKMVQILPVNDTTVKLTKRDSYPYKAITVFALHPIYLKLEALPGFSESVDQKEYDQNREKLNKLPSLDYEQVIQLKMKYARAAFESEKETFGASRIFKKFLQENSRWLKPYAAFSYLRDKYQTANFNEWGKESVFTDKLLKKLTAPKAAHYDEIAFYYYLQFHLDQQLGGAAKYARQNGVVLKGDIPIGINRESVDAWVAPRLYNMNGQAGAPPDDFAIKGQNWEFPTYNWEEMARDGYQWWQDRFSQMARYFDAFRIDHILGFFRIWEIPLEQVEGIMGFFNPALPIERSEFTERGIAFDYERFCQPYLPGFFIDQLFEEKAAYVKANFLEPLRQGLFQLKEEFATQRQIEKYCKEQGKKDGDPFMVKLFDLVSNVLFLEVPGSERRQFHPRISMMDTLSYETLDGDLKQRVYDLYVDYFYRRQEDFWLERALEKLPAVSKATNMLICGEDLGMVPACVPGLMRDLEILTLEIQRMSKNPATEFLAEKDIPYLSVCSPATHDMSPIRLWWEESADDQIQRFYQDELGMEGSKPAAGEPYIVEAIIRQHLGWPGMWAVFPLQDLLGMDDSLRRADPNEERINVPSDPNHYWRYRLHLNIEDLLKAEAFNEKIREMLKESGR